MKQHSFFSQVALFYKLTWCLFRICFPRKRGFDRQYIVDSIHDTTAVLDIQKLVCDNHFYRWNILNKSGIDLGENSDDFRIEFDNMCQTQIGTLIKSQAQHIATTSKLIIKNGNNNRAQSSQPSRTAG